MLKASEIKLPNKVSIVCTIEIMIRIQDASRPCQIQTNETVICQPDHHNGVTTTIGMLLPEGIELLPILSQEKAIHTGQRDFGAVRKRLLRLFQTVDAADLGIREVAKDAASITDVISRFPVSTELTPQPAAL